MESKTKFLIFVLLSVVCLLLVAFENNLFGVKTPNYQVITFGGDTSQAYAKPLTASQQEWLINNRVAQYSPRLIVFNNRARLAFETLVLYNSGKQTSEDLRRQLKFIVMFAAKNQTNQTWKLIKVDVKEAFGYATIISVKGVTRYLWKVRAEIDFNPEEIDIDSIVYFVTDYRKYKELIDQDSSNWARALSFQTPIVQNGELEKRPAIAHCVHMVRDLGDEKKLRQMKEWLIVQQELGIEQLKLYVYELNETTRKSLEQFIESRINKIKIEMIDFRHPKFEKTCKTQIDLARAIPTSKLAKIIADECQKFYSSHLGEHWPALHTFELVATNDCLTSFKYEFEFVTNFDFDEFILPRRHLPTHDISYVDEENANLTCESLSNSQSKATSPYTLYNYVRDLIAEDAKNSSSNRTIASLHFKHMLMFSRLPAQFVSDLLNVSLLNEKRTVMFDYFSMRIYFIVDPAYDSSLRAAFNRTRQLGECMSGLIDKRHLDGTNITINWNRLYGIWMNLRCGKSVFNTDYVDLINQHELQHSSDPNAQVLDVPIDLGYVSHFRESIDIQFFLGQTYSFSSNFRIDFEYYLFAMRVWDKNCCS